MAAYNFRRRFAVMVEDGRKRQTIRRIRKAGNAVPGGHQAVQNSPVTSTAVRRWCAIALTIASP